jgi:hypothetical protein
MKKQYKMRREGEFEKTKYRISDGNDKGIFRR